MIKTLAQRVIERDVQPLVDALDVGQAGGQELAPQAQILGIACVQLGRFGQHGAADVRMRLGQRRDNRIAFDLGQAGLARRQRCSHFLQVGFGAAQRFGGVFVGRLVASGRGRGLACYFDLLLFQLFAQLRQRRLAFVVIDQAIDQPVEPAELFDGVGGIVGGIQEMLVAVDDHAELGAPVADVVVADHAVAEEAERAARASRR